MNVESNGLKFMDVCCLLSDEGFRVNSIKWLVFVDFILKNPFISYLILAGIYLSKRTTSVRFKLSLLILLYWQAIEGFFTLLNPDYAVNNFCVC